jgi:hypothetical protein
MGFFFHVFLCTRRTKFRRKFHFPHIQSNFFDGCVFRFTPELPSNFPCFSEIFTNFVRSNELPLNSENFVQTGQIHGFTVLQIYSPSFLGKSFSARVFEMHKFKNFPLKLVGCLVTWPLVLTLNPKILGSIPKQLKKANKNNTVFRIRNDLSRNNKNKTPSRKIELRSNSLERRSTLQISTEVQVSGNRQKLTNFSVFFSLIF